MNYIERFKKVTEKMVEITKAKNNDYADTKNNPYKNFQYCEQLGICSVEKGILVRMSDKMSRVSNLMDKEAKVKDEAVEDTLLDLANYSIILALYIKDKKERKV